MDETTNPQDPSVNPATPVEPTADPVAPDQPATPEAPAEGAPETPGDDTPAV